MALPALELRRMCGRRPPALLCGPGTAPGKQDPQREHQYALARHGRAGPAPAGLAVGTGKPTGGGKRWWISE